MDLSAEKVIVVTGASSGLGAALAEQLASRYQCSLVLVARRAHLLDDVLNLVRGYGSKAVAISTDVSIEANCAMVVEKALSEFGAVDVLINNAGRGNHASVEDTTSDDLDAMFSLNVFSQFWLTQRVLPSMKHNGSGYIVNISSFAGKIGFPFNSAYVAAKHAVVGFTASLRAELLGTGVEAVAICPAGIVTEWANVTDGGSIGDLFTAGIKESRTVAQELGLGRAPLTAMMSASEIAEIIIDTICNGRSPDVYTHAATMQQAELAVANRVALEDALAPLYIGMQRSYRKNNS